MSKNPKREETDKIQSFLKNQPPSHELSNLIKHLVGNCFYVLEHGYTGIIIQGNSKSEEFISKFLEQASIDDKIDVNEIDVISYKEFKNYNFNNRRKVIVKDPERTLPGGDGFFLVNVDEYLSHYTKDKNLS